MPEWEANLRKAIAAAGFDAERAAEIYEEIAGHLENGAEFRREDREMLRHGLLCVRLDSDGDRRAHRLWLPAFYCGVVSMLLLRALTTFGAGLRAFWIPDPHQQQLVFCIQWLALLPVVGALVSIYAARHGAGRAQRLLAAVFPAAMIGSLFIAGFVPKFLFFPEETLRLLPVFGSTMLSWVIAPGFALAAGALPFLVDRHERPSGS